MIRLLASSETTAVASPSWTGTTPPISSSSRTSSYGMENRTISLAANFWRLFRGKGDSRRGGPLQLRVHVPACGGRGRRGRAGPAHGFLGRQARYFSARDEWRYCWSGRWRSVALSRTSSRGRNCWCWSGRVSSHAAIASARFAGPDLEAVIALQRGFPVRSSASPPSWRGGAVERMAERIVVAEVDGEVAAKAETMVRTRRHGPGFGGRIHPAGTPRPRPGRECMSLLCARLLDDYEAAVLNVALRNQPALRLYRGLGFRHAATSPSPSSPDLCPARAFPGLIFFLRVALTWHHEGMVKEHTPEPPAAQAADHRRRPGVIALAAVADAIQPWGEEASGHASEVVVEVNGQEVAPLSGGSARLLRGRLLRREPLPYRGRARCGWSTPPAPTSSAWPWATRTRAATPWCACPTGWC